MPHRLRQRAAQLILQRLAHYSRCDPTTMRLLLSPPPPPAEGEDAPKAAPPVEDVS